MLINAGADVNLASKIETDRIMAADYEEPGKDTIDNLEGFECTRHYFIDNDVGVFSKTTFIRVNKESDPYKGKVRSQYYHELKHFLCDTPLWLAAEKSKNLPLVKLLLLNDGKIYRPLSKDGLDAVNGAIAQLFEKSKLLFCSNQDSSSLLAVLPKELVHGIASIINQLILTTMVKDEFNEQADKHLRL